MTWRTYLQVKTRQSAFLWRLAVGILIAGAVLGFTVQWLPESVTGWLRGDTAPLIRHGKHLQRLAERGDWAELWWAIPRSMWLGLLPGPATIAVVTGACWLTFALQAGQPRAPGGVRPWLALVAVVLGVASIWPTLFAIFWQQVAWGLEESDDLVDGVRFFVLGVGLREELAKLLLFLPLVPWIVRRGSEREALLVAACVGLGFAIEENVMYFTRNPAASVGRFLTANFMHMSLTGLAGLAVCRAVWHPRERAAEAGAMVLLMILAHGLYDAALMPVFGEYSIVAFILYVLLAFQFFRELRQWWKPRGEPISLTATFIAAVSLVAAVTFVYIAAILSFDTALDAVILPGISSGVLVYVFLREMPESLVEV